MGPQVINRHLSPSTRDPEQDSKIYYLCCHFGHEPLQYRILMHGHFPMHPGAALCQYPILSRNDLEIDILQWLPFTKGHCLSGRTGAITSFVHAALTGSSDLVFAALPVFMVGAHFVIFRILSSPTDF